MEPPAVNVGLGFQARSNNSLDKNRRDLMLRIDATSSYASTSHVFEELPENFLESISPQQSTSRSLEIITNHSQNTLSSCLSPGLSDQRFTNDSADLLPHLSEPNGLNVAVDDLNEPRREIYIKEESPEPYNNQSACETIYLPSTYEQDDEELCNMHRHSPISLQNDMTSSGLNVDEHFMPTRQIDTLIMGKNSEKSPSPVDSKEGLLSTKTEEETSIVNYAALFDLNMELDDNVSIDTKNLCKQIANELKQHSIPQAVFADKILCRSQGTLSDLLRNPKPWDKLKSGRETFRRMYNWMSQPLNIRLAILDIRDRDTSDLASLVNSSPPTPAKSSRIRQPSVSDESVHSYKRPRLVFSDVQKSTLQAIFKETQRPSREMQTTIAEHLGLDLSTVSNFFMNARRRNRNGGGLLSDDMSGFDKITSPIETSPKYRRHNPSTSSTSTGTSSASFDPQHINEAIDGVISNFATKTEEEFQESSSNYENDRSSHRIEQNFTIKSECVSPPLKDDEHV